MLRWLAAEVAFRIAHFRPGSGAAGTAYARVVHEESGKLMQMVEEHILKQPWASGAIANLISLLYGTTDLGVTKALLHLRGLAAAQMSAFSPAELMGLASGLANCEQLDPDFLQDLRRAVDAAAASAEAGEASVRFGDQGSEAQPRILREFHETLAIWKPAGWSCATGQRNKSEMPQIGKYLADMGGPSVFQDPTADHGLAHRLDIQTSGVVLVGCTLRSYWRLRLEFCAQQVSRQYLVLAHGHLPFTEQVADLPLRLTRVPTSARSVRSLSVVCTTGRRGVRRTVCHGQ